jgi:hypothetical protein
LESRHRKRPADASLVEHHAARRYRIDPLPFQFKGNRELVDVAVSDPGLKRTASRPAIEPVSGGDAEKRAEKEIRAAETGGRAARNWTASIELRRGQTPDGGAKCL